MKAIRNISHDITLKTKVELEEGGSRTALEIQREFAELAHSHYESHGYKSELDATSLMLANLWLEGIDAVSYTHIRANETKAKPVSRRSLEKKTSA
ncbi:proteasome accessory factor PafA2 family protein, partial [Leclercia adecarboxylata]|uniref:proteasome accessory factor PafA2 family protein n=1 Tax=Leclercia adecarboxylata TaxID=83655 RepID=UPI00234C50B5